VDLLDVRKDSTYCRQIAVDLVGVGKWRVRNKYKVSRRILSKLSNTEVAPNCNGFRKKLK
jgi:hypothetical protein